MKSVQLHGTSSYSDAARWLQTPSDPRALATM